MKRICLLLGGLLTALQLCAGFEVQENNGNYHLLLNGQVVFSAIESCAGKTWDLPDGTKHSERVLPDGTKVYQLWNENPDCRFRREIALRSDGCVEITMAGEVPAFSENRMRMLRLRMPYAAVSGSPYEALSGNGRKFLPVKGEFAPDLKNGKLEGTPFRFLALKLYEKNFIFDFLPLGAGDYCTGYVSGTVRGVWNVEKIGDELVFSCGSSLPRMGGFTGTKVILREGKFSDYDQLHALRAFHYSDHLKPERLYCFGAPHAGSMYQSMGLAPWSEAAKAGWLGDLSGIRIETGYPEGAYYSSAVGENGQFQVTGLRRGWYVVTVGAGNYNGVENSFSVKVNDTPFITDLTVKPRSAAVLSRAVYLKDGSATVTLSGKFLLSTLGFQCVMTESEDFSMKRGFWMEDAYEPGSIYRNEDYKVPLTLPAALDQFTLPEPGKETALPRLEMAVPTELPDPNAPEMAWMRNAHMFKILGNSSTLAELDAPGAAERLIDEELKGKHYNAAIISGMHSRHTYFNHLKRGADTIKRIAGICHARGLKLFDHHDSTMLWHSDAGFRVLMDRLPEVSRGVLDLLPSFQFCPIDPVYKETYFHYLLDLVRGGVDGFQIDELQFWAHSCGCGYCREQFHRDTNWYLPVNELDPRLNNMRDELWQVWFDWHRKQVGNWWVEFRRRARKINPYLTLCMYTTHWGFTRSQPRYNSSHDLFELGRAINYFGTEVMSRNVLQTGRSLVPFRKMKNVLTDAFGTPVWSWLYASDWPTVYFGWAAANMTNQAAFLPNLERPEGASDFALFESSPDNMNREKAKAAAEVALLFAQSSRDWNPNASFEGELFGMAQTLETMHLPYEFIAENNLTAERLKRYKVLLLGVAGCLSDAQLELIKDFAHNGGTVCMTTVAGFFTPLGVERKVWGFADVFGFTPQPAKSYSLLWVGKSPDFKKAVLLKRPMYLDYLVPPETPALLYGFNYRHKMAPLAVVKNYGKGRMVYLTAQLGLPFYEPEAAVGRPWPFELDRKLESLYRALLEDVVTPGRFWQVKAPDKVFTALWRDGNKLLIHFLNGTGANMKAGEILTDRAPQDPYPALTEDIVFTVPGNYRSAAAASPDFVGRKSLVLKKNGDGCVTVTLPKELLKAYTIVHME